MDEMRKYIKKRIEHAEKRIKEKEDYNKNPSKYTFHGGKSIGYWEGLAEGYKNTMDKLDEIEGKPKGYWEKDS